jgi:hypothetical protein
MWLCRLIQKARRPRKKKIPMFDINALIDAIIAKVKESFQAELAAAVQDAHDKGVAEGQAMGVDPVVVQAQIDAAVAAKVVEVKGKLGDAVAAELSAEAAAQAALKAVVDAL